jgi:hypothetical protein
VSDTVKKTFQFASAVLLAGIVFELVTFEMPFSHELTIWMRAIISQVAEVPAICVCAWLGAYPAFRLFPKNLNIKPRQFLWMAAAFVLITYFALSWLGNSSLILVCLIPIIVAFATVQSLGRWIASRNA